MYQAVTTGRFDRDLRLTAKRGKDLEKLKAVMNMLVAGEVLPVRNRDHALIGNYASRRECHIEPDWLLIYKLDKEQNLIIFERTGTHSDLF
jgi:mRNA interferase YafQ